MKTVSRQLAQVAIASCVALAGCGGKSEKDMLASARSFLVAKDEKSAIVELKAALQKNPASAEARYLMGDALLKSGDAAGALLELEKAREAKHSDDDVVPKLAFALLATGQTKKVTERFAEVTLIAPKSAAELKAAVGVSYIAQGAIEKGEAAVDAALKLDAKCVPARMFKARLLAGRGAADEALSMIDGVIAEDPKRADSRQLKGELQWLAKSDPAAATKTFRDILSTNERYLPAHLALIRLMIETQDAPGFDSQIAFLKKALPNQLETLYFETQMALLKGDLARARDGGQQLLKLAPESAMVRQMAGAIEVQNGALQLAESHLNKALQLAPDLLVARRLLVETHIRSGQTDKALAALQPLLSQANTDPNSLALAAEVYLQRGDLVKAESFYLQADRAKPNDAKVRTALALIQMARGNSDAGLSRLEALAASDAGTFADMALISTRMQRNDLDGALKAVDGLVAKRGKQPQPHFLRGRILVQRSDPVVARGSFEKALEVDPVYYPAVAELSALDLAEGRPDAAVKRFETILKRDPRAVLPSVGLAEAKKRLGAKPEVVEALLADTVKANPGEVLPRLMLVEHYLSVHQVKEAVSTAQDAATAMPDNEQVQEALGQVHLLSGDTQQAIAIFRRLAAAQPNSVRPLLGLSDAHMAAKDYGSARQSLRRALEIAPENLLAHRGLVVVALADRQFDEALQVARGMQKRLPSLAAGYLIESEVHAGHAAWGPAIGALKAALERNRSTELAVRIHSTYLLAGRDADATKFAKEWLQSRPRDVVFIGQLGLIATQRKDYATAESRYREVLSIQPDNASANNNLAWVLLQLGKPGALSLAQRANELVPDHAPYLDTLALALAAEKQSAKAIEVQQRAVDKYPDAPGYRLRLAKLLIEANDLIRARAELDKLAALGAKLPERAEVAGLIAHLGSK